MVGPTHGALTLNADGSLSYVPDANFNGTDTFTYKANDGTLDSNVATVTITVKGVNDKPVAVDDVYSTDEDTTLTVVAADGVLKNDSDIDSGTLTAILVVGPTHGALTLNADGSLSYVPDANFNGTDTFTYKANDGTLDSNVATVTITVKGVNDKPVAVDDVYSTDEDTTLTVVAADGVLKNDSDIDSGTLTAILVVGPTHGALTLNADGSLSYVPDANFNGTDTFTYKANDGTLDSNVATVTITVKGVNDKPVAVDDVYSTDEDTTLTVVAADGVLKNDSDIDSGTLTAILVVGPTHGALTLNADGSLSYVPDANFNGTDTFTYKANDGTLDSNVATVTITVKGVNDKPVAVDDVYSTDEDTTLTVVAADGVLKNDSDIDSGTLTAILVVGPTHGALTLNADGSLSYVPDANFNGTDTFTYKANDGTLDSNVATVTITVKGVNDKPVAVDDVYSTDEDTTLTVVAADGVLKNDSDIDSGTLTAILVVGPTHGALTLNADGSLSYVPDANFNGTDTFTYKANDGTLDSNVATVTITVKGVNDKPVAVDDVYSTDEDTTLTVVAADGVLKNDSDIDSGTLTAILVVGPTHGALTLNADGSLSYVPDANFNGTDTFTYKANDGTLDSNVATVTITVKGVNDKPVAVDDVYSTDEDTTLTVVAADGVLKNDSDIDSGTLTAILVVGPTHGALTLNADGSLSYVPDANFNGTDTFTYKANDGTLDSNVATVTITVKGVNDKPVAVDDVYSTDEDTTLTVVAADGVLKNDSDIDSGTLTAILVVGPTHGALTLNADGSLSYVPDANFNGTDTFTYKANDGTLDSNVATVTITVKGVNDKPVAVDDVYSTDEDTTLTVVAADGVLKNDSDIDSGTLTAILVVGPTHGALTLNADGSLSYVPDANFNGTDTFTYKANDGTLDSNVATVTITVKGVNDKPVAVDDVYSTDEDTTLTVVAADGVLKNDSDIDSGTLTAILVVGPTHGALTLNADGSLSYVPDANFNGTDTFTYKANDGTLDSNVATVTITVKGVNDKPVAVDDVYSTDEDTTLTVVAADGVLKNDSDIDSGTLTAILVVGPTHGALTLNADGSLSYVPDANFNGTDTFTYKANDGTLDSNVATVTITVKGVNDKPVAVDDVYSTDEDTTLTVVAADGVLKNDSDIDSGTLTAILVVGPTHGALTLNADGSLSYVPDANFNGTDTFTYKANDGTLDSNVATVTITVKGVNDKPVAVDDVYSTDEDTTLTVVAADGVLKNDSDIDSGTLTAILVVGPTHGALTLNADGSLSYVPDANFNGTDTFTYKANDGTLDSNVATVTITVKGVNDKPVAVDDVYSTDEDTTLTVVAADGVLKNDSDIDSGTLTAILVVGPTHGALTLNADGSLSYVPDANFNGTDTFTYKANDGTLDSNVATVTITVKGVNDKPLTVDVSKTIPEPAADQTVTLTLNGSDIDGDGLTYSTSAFTVTPNQTTVSMTAGACSLSGSTVTCNVPADWNGTIGFTYSANDGTVNSDLSSGTITVTPENDKPVAKDVSKTIVEPDTNEVVSLPLDGSDIDGDTLGYSVGTFTITTGATTVADPSDCALVAGVVNCTIPADWNGTITFPYTVTAGGETATATGTITVTAANDKPVATDVSKTILEPDTNEGVSLNLNGSDIDGDALTYSVGTFTITKGNTLSVNPSDCQLVGEKVTCTIPADWNGTITFPYTVTAGGETATATGTITVTAVNDAPIAQDSTNTTYVDTAVTGTVKGTDIDSTILTYSVTPAGEPSHGSIVMNPDGSYTYTPATSYAGTDWVTYTVCDNAVDQKCDTGTIMIVIYPKATTTGGGPGVGGVGGLVIPVTGLAGGYRPLIAAGEKHTCAMVTGGIQCWGDNQYGQIGDGTKEQRLVPTSVKGVKTDIIAIVAGQNHTCILTKDGAVQCWGDNQYGQLGDGTKEIRKQATDVKGLSSGVIAISAGQNHTCALKNDGTVWCWGYNGEGQLNDGTTQNSSTPVKTKVEGAFGYFSASMLDTYMMVGDKNEETGGWLKGLMDVIDPLENMVSVYGNRFSDGGCAVEKETGDLYCWSGNGKAEKVEGVTDMLGVSSGLGQVCGMTNTFALYCWGENASGQVGNGTTVTQETPVEIKGITGGVIAVAAGYNHTCAVTGTNDVYCWGQNKYGQLGDDSTTDRTQPTLVIDVP